MTRSRIPCSRFAKGGVLLSIAQAHPFPPLPLKKPGRNASICTILIDWGAYPLILSRNTAQPTEGRQTETGRGFRCICGRAGMHIGRGAGCVRLIVPSAMPAGASAYAVGTGSTRISPVPMGRWGRRLFPFGGAGGLCCLALNDSRCSDEYLPAPGRNVVPRRTNTTFCDTVFQIDNRFHAPRTAISSWPGILLFGGSQMPMSAQSLERWMWDSSMH